MVAFCGSPSQVRLPLPVKTFQELALPHRVQGMPLELVPELALLLPAALRLFVLFLVPVIP